MVSSRGRGRNYIVDDNAKGVKKNLNILAVKKPNRRMNFPYVFIRTIESAFRLANVEPEPK